METNLFFSKRVVYFVSIVAGFLIAVVVFKFFISLREEQSVILEPIRSEYSELLPPNIPEVLIPKTTEGIEQSYLLDYLDQGVRQSTFVISLEKKTPLEIFTEYESLLREAGWVVVNVFETPELASLYVVKDAQEVNITIRQSSNKEGSTLSVSVLNK